MGIRHLLLSRFSIFWDPAALVVFYRLPMHSAMLVDRAVVQFAETGEGRLEWVAPYYRLCVGSFYIPLTIDVESRSLTVLRIRRSRE